MTRFVAFVRAINVGGHTVKMDDLRQQFESLGFSGVETFIASGNVVFETNSADNSKELEKQIEHKLRQAFGYEVVTFIRTISEIADIANYQPFQQSDLELAIAFNVAFLAGVPSDELKQKLMALRTDIDNFHVNGREVYWLSRKKQSESTFSNAVFEKILGQKSTLRGVNTIKKMAAKYSVSGLLP
jgi:Uncharacterized protein conserved in bacteria